MRMKFKDSLAAALFPGERSSESILLCRSFIYGLALMNLIPAHPSYLLEPEEFF